MTTEFNKLQTVSVAQEKNTMHDHESLSSSAQLSSLHQSILDDRNQSSSQPLAPQAALRPCIYIALRCSRCGSVRQAITELPAQAFVACPECSKECAFVVLGSGLTSRPLPFHQVYIIEPTQWDSQLGGEANSS
jgi:hypothetical protein